MTTHITLTGTGPGGLDAARVLHVHGAPATVHEAATELRWKRIPGLTPLGDAAHRAAPDGEGASLAIPDGAEHRALAVHPGDIEDTLTAHEQTPFPRGTEGARHGTTLFGGNAPHGPVTAFTGAEERTSHA